MKTMMLRGVLRLIMIKTNDVLFNKINCYGNEKMFIGLSREWISF